MNVLVLRDLCVLFLLIYISTSSSMHLDIYIYICITQLSLLLPIKFLLLLLFRFLNYQATCHCAPFLKRNSFLLFILIYRYFIPACSFKHHWQANHTISLYRYTHFYINPLHYNRDCILSSINYISTLHIIDMYTLW